MKTVQFKDAEAKLSAVVDDAVAGEPTVLARDGKNEAVVISFDEYEKNYRKPGEPGDIPERTRSPMREVDLTDVGMKTVQFKDAKAKLSAVVDNAIAGEPTMITRHGKEEAVVLSASDYRKLSNVPSFAELLLAFPGEPDDLERNRKPLRDRF